MKRTLIKKVLSALAHAYTKRGIVMQLHLAAIRNTNARMFSILGADTGYDASHDHQISVPSWAVSRTRTLALRVRRLLSLPLHPSPEKFSSARLGGSAITKTVLKSRCTFSETSVCFPHLLECSPTRGASFPTRGMNTLGASSAICSVPG